MRFVTRSQRRCRSIGMADGWSTGRVGSTVGLAVQVGSTAGLADWVGSTVGRNGSPGRPAPRAGAKSSVAPEPHGCAASWPADPSVAQPRCALPGPPRPAAPAGKPPTAWEQRLEPRQRWERAQRSGRTGSAASSFEHRLRREFTLLASASAAGVKPGQRSPLRLRHTVRAGVGSALGSVTAGSRGGSCSACMFQTHPSPARWDKARCLAGRSRSDMKGVMMSSVVSASPVSKRSPALRSMYSGQSGMWRRTIRWSMSVATSARAAGLGPDDGYLFVARRRWPADGFDDQVRAGQQPFAAR